METEKEIKLFRELFSNEKENKIQFVIPPYQRAYSWEETQWSQFEQDLRDFKGKKGYYFGHYIFEDDNNGTYYLIDGQQRFTTFILFLLVCRFYHKDFPYDNYISKLKIVNYDHLNFIALQEHIKNKNEWNIDLPILPINLPELPITLSLIRIISAMNYFHQAFKKERLDPHCIRDYIEIIIESHISVHRTMGKDVAVQIFELHNTRGIRLNTIERVKAKLMKAVYHSSNKKDETENAINEIQKEFAEIFKLEEQTANSSFRGELALDEILLSHLRVVDDGSKIQIGENNFNSPSRGGNREEQILNYVDAQLRKYKGNECLKYSINLSVEFRKSLEVVSLILPKLDEKDLVIGDVLILEKDISCEFFLIISRCLNWEEKNVDPILKDNFIEMVLKWEKLLFTRDFHDKYYNLKGTRDNFQQLFSDIKHAKGLSQIAGKIDDYIKSGFRGDKMNYELQTTYKDFISKNRDIILENTFYWYWQWREKMVYVLYKFERTKNVDIKYLRKIMKTGRSVDHILPQGWDPIWINDKSKSRDEFNNSIQKCINGIGNLLLISGSENSSYSNTKPQDKIYQCAIQDYEFECTGSYKEHNDRRGRWEDSEEWEKIIKERGVEIFNFMTNELFSAKI
jgi:hypothetical protein